MGRDVYHLALNEAMVEGAKIALLPGDPKRVDQLADSPFLQNARFLADKREFRSWIAYAGGIPVLITSTGIGGPSASIAIDELAQLGIRTMIRVGTTGAIQPEGNIGDVIITAGAIRLDGASTHYAPVEYPAVAHYRVVNALVDAAEQEKVPYHVGVTCSCDTFYPGQERTDSFTGYVPRRFQGITAEWRALHVLNYEMEAATLLTMTAAMGLRGGCVEGVIVNRTRDEHITMEDLHLGERNSVNVAVRAVAALAGEKL